MTNEEFVNKAVAGMGEATKVVNSGKKPDPDADADISKLRAFVNTHKLAMAKDGKAYLKVEAWQYIAKLKGIVPSFDSAMEIMNGVDTSGKEQRYLMVSSLCTLKDKNGNEVSRANMVATNLEPFLLDKQMFAVYGMSQTRAFSRAMRNIYGYLAVAAGFQAVPWEEIA